MHRGFFLPVKAFPPAPNGPGTGGGRCHATYLCGERFNSRPPRGERPSVQRVRYSSSRISIHALREESDSRRLNSSMSSNYFNPRPPRGGRHIPAALAAKLYAFQSTPSARRATTATSGGSGPFRDFNPRPPRGGRLLHAVDELSLLVISIHALREEGDPRCPLPWPEPSDFNPRPPRGGRPEAGRMLGASDGISIHALLFSDQRAFQSTPSARRATVPAVEVEGAFRISIHALREEGD